MIVIKGYKNQEIASFPEWERFALPPERKSKHWKESRSAYELGRSWTRIHAPVELIALLESNTGTRSAVISAGRTEHETPLPPSGSGGPRCHDLLLEADRDGSKMTICIEAKADEPFGGTIAEELKKAGARSGSRFPQRLNWLTHSLLGIPAFEGPNHSTASGSIASLPYQLLPAIAGTLLEAESHGSASAVFVVHEFRTDSTKDEKLEANAKALDGFLRQLLAANHASQAAMPMKAGEMMGPILIIRRDVPGTDWHIPQIPLFIGKIQTNRRGKDRNV